MARWQAVAVHVLLALLHNVPGRHAAFAHVDPLAHLQCLLCPASAIFDANARRHRGQMLSPTSVDGVGSTGSGAAFAATNSRSKSRISSSAFDSAVLRKPLISA